MISIDPLCSCFSYLIVYFENGKLVISYIRTDEIEIGTMMHFL